jgi:hypothetical protein
MYRLPRNVNGNNQTIKLNKKNMPRQKFVNEKNNEPYNHFCITQTYTNKLTY